jgi:hypothetical protein
MTSMSYGPPWAHYLGGYQDRRLGWPLGLLGLCHTIPDWHGAQGLGWRSTRIGSYTCLVLCRELLDVPDWYSLLKQTCNPASQAI